MLPAVACRNWSSKRPDARSSMPNVAPSSTNISSGASKRNGPKAVVCVSTGAMAEAGRPHTHSVRNANRSAPVRSKLSSDVILGFARSILILFAALRAKVRGNTRAVQVLFATMAKPHGAAILGLPRPGAATAVDPRRQCRRPSAAAFNASPERCTLGLPQAAGTLAEDGKIVIKRPTLTDIGLIAEQFGLDLTLASLWRDR